MESLDIITIEDMLDNIFKTSSVKKKRKDIVAYYNKRLDVNLFGQSEGNGVTSEEISKRVDAVLKEDKNSVDPYLRYANSLYSKAKRKTSPINPPSQMPDTNYIGKGGECFVMGWLLFHGYNVNNMMVDEGIDLVASKENVFYYIQVKTKSIDLQNKCYFQIKQDRFDAFVGTQIRYILVARCSIVNEDKILFFTFSNNDIQRLRFNNVIPTPADGSTILSLKIEYDPRTGKAYMYDGKFREDVSFNMNNFNL